MIIETVEAGAGKRASEMHEGRSSVLTRMAPIIFYGVVFLTFVAGIWLRWDGLNAQSLWADEGFTTWISRFQPKEIQQILMGDTAPPLYYIVLHYWIALLGTSEASFRALSALFGTLSLGVVYLFARRMWPSRVFAVLSLMLYAVSFFQIWYAKESRNYAALSFFVLASVYCLQLYLEKPSALRLLGVVAAVSANLYTHNMALYYMPGLVVFWFLYPSNMIFRDRLKRGMIAGAMVILLYIPWMPVLVKQARSVHGYFWAPKPTLTDLCNTLCVFSGLDVYVLKGVRHHVPIPRLFGFWFWVILLLLVLILCIVGTWLGTAPADRRKSIALQVYALSPILLAFVWSRISTSVYVNRNLIGACALLPLVLCAPSAVHVGSKLRFFQIVGCCTLLGAVVSLCLHRESKDDWRGGTEYLLKIPERQRLVEVFQPYCQILVHYYSRGLFKSYPQPEIEGMITQFDVVPSGPRILPDFQVLDPATILTTAIESRRYKEIDVALQMERLPAKAQEIPNFLRAHCASVENVEFGKIAISRCLLQSE